MFMDGLLSLSPSPGVLLASDTMYVLSLSYQTNKRALTACVCVSLSERGRVVLNRTLLRRDEWGEVDTRFSYCALSCCKLIGRIDAIDVDKAVAFIASCKNFDGGFGCTPGGEYHAGQIFTCVGALAIGGGLRHVDADLLGWWLCERQVKAGGLNGRPEKLPDVCYSWWVLSSLSILKRLHWIDRGALAKFILMCQDPQKVRKERNNHKKRLFLFFFRLRGCVREKQQQRRPNKNVDNATRTDRTRTRTPFFVKLTVYWLIGTCAVVIFSPLIHDYVQQLVSRLP